MKRVYLVFSVLAVGSVVAKGKISLGSVTQCVDPDTNTFSMKINQENINDTHDSISVTFDLKEEINEDFGITLQICKKVDGSCELIREVVEPKLCDLIKLSAVEDSSFMSNAGLPSDCPIPKGQYEFAEFIYDNSKIPEEYVGQYQLELTVRERKEQTDEYVIVGCMMVEEINIGEEDDQ